MNRISKILLFASIGLLLTGVGLAVAQPGDLGGTSSDPADEVAFQDTTTTVAPAQTPGSTPATTAAPTVTAPPGTLPVNLGGATPAQADDTTTTTLGGGSGLGTTGPAQPSDTANGLASTGGTSMILLGLTLGGLALAGQSVVVRRRPLDAA